MGVIKEFKTKLIVIVVFCALGLGGGVYVTDIVNKVNYNKLSENIEKRERITNYEVSNKLLKKNYKEIKQQIDDIYGF